MGYRKPRIGFTLIELIIVIAIISILGAIATPNFRKAREQRRVGLSAGGAKDIGNFRENVRNGYLPIPEAITHEGLFYDYTFDTGLQEEPDQLFSPSYCSAVSRHPLTGEVETYVSVGLNSNLELERFHRKHLNLMMVLDVSGSMDEQFGAYYYDGKTGNQTRSPMTEREQRLSKLQVATRAIVDLLDQLDENDRFGLVVFDDRASLAIPLEPVRKSHLAETKNLILQIRNGGSTNLEDGMSRGLAQFATLPPQDPEVFENRVILLTDAMPNTGDCEDRRFLGLLQGGAVDRIYTTFVGIGLDANMDLINRISQVRGANYYSVQSPADFRKRLNQEFAYMVTPLVFNLRLRVEAAGYDVKRVIGSPEAKASTGELMTVNTLFPSPVEEGLTKGGVILLQLAKTSPQAKLRLIATYEDRSGKVSSSSREIFLEKNPDTYDNVGIRKAVLLTRYVDFLQACTAEERGRTSAPGGRGSQWEQSSVPLGLSAVTRGRLQNLRQHFLAEMKVLEDKTLTKEIDLMNQILAASTPDANMARTPTSSPPGL